MSKADATDPYAKTSGDPPQDDREEERLPTEEEKCYHRADMERDHDEGGEPNNGLRKCSVAHGDPLHLSIIPLLDLMGGICL